ncbi:MAG: hypothetical protein WC067_04200 [Candidatus Methanomethylophilaceae archaeon]
MTSKRNHPKIIALALVTIMCITALPMIFSSDLSEAVDDTTITITEIGPSSPQTYTFSAPVDHIVSFSKGYTNTAVKLNVFDKIVLMDSGSAYSDSGIVATEGLADSMFISTTSTNVPNVVIRMAELESAGSFDKDKDVVVCNSYSTTLVNTLRTAGYTVIGYYPKSYDQNVQITEDLGKLFGSDNYESVVQAMKDAPKKVADKLSENGINDENKVRAVSVSTNKIQSTGSMGGTLIELGGGINVAADKNPGSGTSFASDPSFFAQNEIDVLFYSPHNGETALEYVQEMGINSDVKVVEIGNLWVSYGANVDDGLWGYAGSMYPEYFSTSGEVYDLNNNNDDTVMIVAAAIVIVLIVGTAIYFVKFRQ